LPKPWRIATVVGFFVVAVVVIVVLVIGFTKQPPTVDYSNAQSGQPVDVTLQTVGAYGSAPHPTWVSYLIKDPSTGQWVHTSYFQVPAHTRVNMTIIQYDSGSPLRNQQTGMVTGTAGKVALLNGKPFHVYNSNAGNGVGHTFSIPTLGINVPLVGNNANANLCSAAPCTEKSPHNVLKFSFTSPGSGSYPWQCFVPCGLGFLYGNGGPMQTNGYMAGFMKVVA